MRIPKIVIAAALASLCLAPPQLARGADIRRVAVSDLDLIHAVQAGGAPVKDGAVDKKGRLSIGGVVFDKGLGTRAPGAIQVWLGRKALRFRAAVGIDDGAAAAGSAAFAVLGDARVLWQGPVMRRGDKAVSVEADLRGVERMTLLTGIGDRDPDLGNADWADAWVEYEEDAPRTVPFRDPLYGLCGWEGRSEAPLATPVPLPFVERAPGPITDYIVLMMSSPWGREYEARTWPLSKAGFRFLQTTGRSAKGLRPFLILFNVRTRKGTALSLAYSGNWSIAVVADGDAVRLEARTSPAGLPEITRIGGLPVPGALVSRFEGHWDHGTLPIVRFIRRNLRRDLGPAWPVVQYNDYYATFGDMTEPILVEAAGKAARAGCELFTVDAGWYGDKPQWEEAVGDWFVNVKKFPRGIRPVSDAVRGLGLKFGMWVEVESVHPKSEAAARRPDWVMVPTAWWTPRRILNFGRPDVLEYARGVIDRMVRENGLDYIKMDFNADPATGSERYRGAEDPLYGHYRGLASLWRGMRERYPALIVENCSSGSLREDGMTAALTDTHWTSDNVENVSNLGINYGATFLFPPEICSHWTTYPDQPENLDALDVPSRFTVNMMVHLGLSGKIWEWSEGTRAVAAERIASYKAIRPILRRADVYHLTDPPDLERPASVTAAQYADPESGTSLVFAFQANDPGLSARLRLRALEPGAAYRIAFPDTLGGGETTALGRDLLDKGLQVVFPRRGASGIIRVEKRTGP